MVTVILIIHLLLAIAMVGAILLQRSEGGALGIGGSGGGMGGLMTGRATANVLTRATAMLAAAFFVTSMTLAILSGGTGERRSIMETQTPAGEGAPLLPAEPSVPLTQ